MSIARLISSSCWNSLKYNEHSLILCNLLNAKIQLITAPEQTTYCSGDPWSTPPQRDNLNVKLMVTLADWALYAFAPFVHGKVGREGSLFAHRYLIPNFSFQGICTSS